MEPSTIVVLSLIVLAAGVCILGYLNYRRDQATFGKIQNQMDLDGIRKFQEQLAALKNETTRNTAEYKNAREELRAKIAKHRAAVDLSNKPGPGEGTN